MTRWRILAVGALVAIGSVSSRADQVRFSKTLAPADQSAVGIERLSSDQVAVLDALIRRDEKTFSGSTSTATPAQPAQFTQRLSPEERHNAGLDLLTADGLSRLNSLVARYESGRSPTLLPQSVTSAIDPQFTAPRPEVHGMISLTYGTGSGGYQAIGGSAVISIDDPAYGTSLMVGYGQARVRGRAIYPWCGAAPLAMDPWSGPFSPFGP